MSAPLQPAGLASNPNYTGSQIFFRKIYVTRAEIAAIFTTPKVLIPAITGKTIVPIPFCYVQRVNYANNWTTGSELTMISSSNTGVNAIGSIVVGYLTGTATTLFNRIDFAVPSSTGGRFVKGDSIVLTSSANPTGTGDFTLNLYVFYYII